MLKDKYGRQINYMRLAVTDRCNLRCFYCMPESGIKYVNRKDLLTFEEMSRLTQVFSEQGVNKIRITGGEPFVRKGLMDFLQDISKLPKLNQINITTNGTFSDERVKELEDLGIHSVNLSLDSLDPNRFFNITRRDYFEEVMRSFYALADSSMQLKVNMVVMEGRNIEDIYPMLELTKDLDVVVRFIEEMPFNGLEGQGNATYWPMNKILDHIRLRYDIEKLPDPPSSTSSNYQINGYKGSFGVIAAFTRSFCGSCNRIRITPQGDMRTCLYAHSGVSFRDFMRQGVSDRELVDFLKTAIATKPKDGFEAEKQRNDTSVSESMATIGG